MRSLKNRVKQILMIGPYGVERRGEKWKVKGVGPRSGQQFTIWEEAPGKWRANGINSAGSRKRERFPATGLAEAVEQGAALLHGEIHDPSHPQLDLSSAFDRAIRGGGGSHEHREDLYQFSGYFCFWAQTKNLTHWHELRLEHLTEYMNGLFKRGLKAKTVSHYFEPIRMASRFTAANWPEHYRNICQTLRLPRHAGRDGIYRSEDGNPSLSFEQVLDFLVWLESFETGPILIPAVLLQGICGLQLREALRLRWTDVDLREGTITIQDHPEFQERVKNEYRVRRIPLPHMVWQALRGIPKGDEKIVPYEGNDNAFAKLLKRGLRRWDEKCDIAPKDLRNTLQTHAMEHAIEEGWNTYLVDRYVGHAPKTVAERHYFGDKKGRMVEVFRKHVSGKINGLIERIESAKGHKRAQPISIVPFLHGLVRG